MKNIRRKVSLIVGCGLFLIVSQPAIAETEYWDTPDKCHIDSDQEDRDKEIVYSHDIIVDNGATWTVKNVVLMSDQSENWQHEIQCHLGVCKFDNVQFTTMEGQFNYSAHYFSEHSTVWLHNCHFAVTQRIGTGGSKCGIIGNADIANSSFNGSVMISADKDRLVRIEASDFSSLSLWYNDGRIDFDLPYSRIDWSLLRPDGCDIYGYYETTSDGSWSSQGTIRRYFPVCGYTDDGNTDIGPGREVSLWYDGTLIDSQLTNTDGCVVLSCPFDINTYNQPHDILVDGVTHRSDIDFYYNIVEVDGGGNIKGIVLANVGGSAPPDCGEIDSDCDLCDDWIELNTISGIVKVRDADSDGYYDQACCSGRVSVIE